MKTEGLETDTRIDMPKRSTTDTKERFAGIEKRLNKHTVKIRGYDEKMDIISRRIAVFSPHVVESFLNEIRQDSLTLHTHLKLMILKTTIATECSFVVRHKMPQFLADAHCALMWAFDQPDTWWWGLDNKPLGECVTAILAEFAASRKTG